MLRQGTHFLPLVLDRCRIPAGNPLLPPVLLPRYRESTHVGRLGRLSGDGGGAERPDFLVVRRYLGR